MKLEESNEFAIGVIVKGRLHNSKHTVSISPILSDEVIENDKEFINLYKEFINEV